MIILLFFEGFDKFLQKVLISINNAYRALNSQFWGDPNLVTAAIALWNTVYLDRVIKAWKEHGRPVDQLLLQNLSPLGWEHSNLTDDYVWRNRF